MTPKSRAVPGAGERSCFRQKENLMRKVYRIFILTFVISFGTVGCTLSLYSNPLPTPTVLFIPTLTSLPPTALPSAPSPTAISITPNLPTTIPATFFPPTFVPPVPVTQAPPPNFCADGQPPGLINSFKSAIQTSNGVLLASLVSPAHGMDARYYRDGRVVNYDQTHAKFLFDSTFQVDWGLAPGSGQPTKGSFHQVILPSLLDIFGKNYTLTCNQLQVGGTTYNAAWPYAGVNFYSVYFSGTQGNGSLDWHTWVIGMEYVNGKPYLYAIMQFFWEP
jgi:hypothetical protein